MSEEKNNPFEQTSLNLDFIDFEISPKFVGVFQKVVQLGEGEKEFTANVFTDIETGEDVFITNSYSIEKGIKIAKEKLKDYSGDIIFQIEFKGQTMINGKPFNKFDVGYCTIKQYEDWSKPKEKKK